MELRTVSILALVIAALMTPSIVQGENVKMKTVTVPKYTVIPVILDNSVSSATNRVGDTFKVHCYGTYCGGFPANTTFIGKLTIVRPRQPKAPGMLKAEITSAVLPDGRRVVVSAVPCNEQGIPKEGRTGKSAESGRRRTGTVAGGAIGAIAGGWAGAAIGAGAGYLIGEAVEGKYTDVTVPVGTKGYITLIAPVTFQIKSPT